eukprot:363936-Chlamydomonas_euryale.AAC.5
MGSIGARVGSIAAFFGKSLPIGSIGTLIDSMAALICSGPLMDSIRALIGSQHQSCDAWNSSHGQHQSSS